MLYKTENNGVYAETAEDLTVLLCAANIAGALEETGVIDVSDADEMNQFCVDLAIEMQSNQPEDPMLYIAFALRDRYGKKGMMNHD